MKKLSLIIPIYNAGEYLHKCILSVLSQTYTDFDLILVNDGSTDDSGMICDEYASKDSRVKVIHKENEGVSIARNVGIKAATGKYIGFIDSDDWIEPNMYECLLSEAERTDADIVMCDATTVYSDGRTQVDTITQLCENRILKKSDFTPPLLLEMAGSAWRCIYKNDLYFDIPRSYPLEFPLGIKFSEDRIFNLYAFGQADKICYIKRSFYNRFINSKSAVHRFHSDYFEACKKSAQCIEQAICNVWNNDEALQKAYLGQLIGGALSAICNYYYKTSPLTISGKKNMIKQLCEDHMLREAITLYGADRRSMWILNKNYTMLIAYAKLANLKHGR